MLASIILRNPTMLRQPASMAARTAFKPMPLAKRYQQLDNRGGKSKLIFRIGLKDIPVELYPIGFCVGIALLGAGVAIGRHLYHDGLRLAPTGKAPEDA